APRGLQAGGKIIKQKQREKRYDQTPQSSPLFTWSKVTCEANSLLTALRALVPALHFQFCLEKTSLAPNAGCWSCYASTRIRQNGLDMVLFFLDRGEEVGVVMFR